MSRSSGTVIAAGLATGTTIEQHAANAAPMPIPDTGPQERR